MAHGVDKHQSRQNRSQVRALFMREWDPIGVADAAEAQDEYDNYVSKAYVVLMDEGATANDIERYLLRIEEEHMGLTLSARSRLRARSTAEALAALKPSFVDVKPQ